MIKITIGQGDDYATVLDYPYFKENYNMITIDKVDNKHLMLIQK